MGANEPASKPIIKTKGIKTKQPAISKPAPRPSAKIPIQSSPPRTESGQRTDFWGDLFGQRDTARDDKKQQSPKNKISIKQPDPFQQSEREPHTTKTTRASRLNSKEWRINKPAIHNAVKNQDFQQNKTRSQSRPTSPHQNPGRQQPAPTRLKTGTAAAASAGVIADRTAKAGKAAAQLAAKSASGVTAGTMAATGAGLALGYMPWNKQTEIEDLGDGRRAFGAPGDFWKREQFYDDKTDTWRNTDYFTSSNLGERRHEEEFKNPDRGFAPAPQTPPNPGFEPEQPEPESNIEGQDQAPNLPTQILSFPIDDDGSKGQLEIYPDVDEQTQHWGMILGKPG